MLVAKGYADLQCGQRTVDLRVIECEHGRNELKNGRTQTMIQRGAAPENTGR